MAGGLDMRHSAKGPNTGIHMSTALATTSTWIP